jgi:hypothetical protein
LILTDTSLLTRYREELKKDTAIKWYEKIINKKPEPDIVYVQKTDTVFIETTKDIDLMLQVKKSDNKLIIRAVNQNGGILKEYIYEDVYNNFSATSKKENIYVKTEKIYWNGLNSIINLQWPIFNKRKPFCNFGLESGINYKNAIQINAGILYSPGPKDLLLNTNLKIKF